MGYVLCVHGGAGALTRDRVRDETDARMRAGLRASLEAGERVLRAGGEAVDAVEAAVRALEADDAFNAGRGSVLTADGTVEMDACVMRGRDRAVGAVAAVRRIVHPVAAARCVLERGEAVLLAGGPADAFAAACGLETAEPGYFVTPLRRQQLARSTRMVLDADAPEPDAGLGTVGAVARDGRGGLAAATSTGGMTLKAPGRVGDSPVPGAGTWAADDTCAVSATGEGERILRSALAHEVDAQLRLGGRTLEEACSRALARVEAVGGRAGCIAIDRQGRLTLPFTTEGMARGAVAEGDVPGVALYGDEPLGA